MGACHIVLGESVPGYFPFDQAKQLPGRLPGILWYILYKRCTLYCCVFLLTNTHMPVSTVCSRGCLGVHRHPVSSHNIVHIKQLHLSGHPANSSWSKHRMYTQHIKVIVHRQEGGVPGGFPLCVTSPAHRLTKNGNNYMTSSRMYQGGGCDYKVLNFTTFL